MRKNYIGICLDKSGSMNAIRRETVKAYNSNVDAIREATIREGQDTILYSNAFGGDVHWLFRNSSISRLKPLTDADYRPDGGTPLFDALTEMVEDLKKVPDYNDPNVAFQVLVISDGAENTSKPANKHGAKDLIRKLQATDRWTFAFLLPRGEAHHFCREYGIPEGNVREWDATEKGTREAFVATSAAYSSYFGDRTRGLTASTKFFTDLSQVKTATVKSKCVDISKDVKVFGVPRSATIRDFVESKTGYPYKLGAAFYELVKAEKVQDHKQIAILHKKEGKVFAGVGARQLLGLPTSGDVKVSPGNQGHYDVFVQSTSVNRKLPAGTRVLHWAGAAP
jgi:hypothetical protein